MILTEGRGFTTPYNAAPPAELMAGAFDYERLFIDVADFIDTDDAGLPVGVGNTLLFTFTVPVPEHHHDDMDPAGQFAEPLVLQTYRVEVEQARQIVAYLTEAIDMISNPIAARERQLDALLERHDAQQEAAPPDPQEPHTLPDRLARDDA